MMRAVPIMVYVFIFVAAVPAAAQTLTQIQPLTFGTFALRNNADTYSIIIAPDDTVTYDPNLIEGPVPAQRGEYLLEAQPPNTALSVTITNGILSDGAGDTFSVINYTDNDPSTDGAGTATVYVGATLRTSGSGNPYDSGGYNGVVDMVIDVE